MDRSKIDKILKNHIHRSLMPWQKKFPETYYTELFRLNGWEYNEKSLSGYGKTIADWTNILVYDQLTSDLLVFLKSKAPGATKTNPELSAQIHQVLTLFRLSENMKEVWLQFVKLNIVDKCPFEFDDKGFTVISFPATPEHTEPLTEFDRNILKALGKK